MVDEPAEPWDGVPERWLYGGVLLLTAFAFGFRIFHHIVQLSDAATLSNPKPCSARSTAKSTKRYSTE